jgi:hypothetical protein
MPSYIIRKFRSITFNFKTKTSRSAVKDLRPSQETVHFITAFNRPQMYACIFRVVPLLFRFSVACVLTRTYVMRNLIHTVSTCHSFRTNAESRTKVFVFVSVLYRVYTKMTCTINVNIILRGQGIKSLRFRSSHISINFFVFLNFDTVSNSSKYFQSARVISCCR